MVHRLALIIGGVGAAAVLSLAVVLGGFTAVVTGSADATATDQLIDDSALNSGTGGSSGKVEAVVDTIYVEDASPKPTASPSADDKDGRSADRHDDDEGDHDDDDGDDHDDDDRSGHRDGGADDDRSGHRDGDRDND